MNRRYIQVILLSILIVVTLGFIWGNSMLPAEDSSEISGSLMELIEEILERIITGYTPAPDTSDTPIRKLAHFMEFMILGIELTILVCQLLKRSLVIPPFCGLLAAVCDETLQLFSDGRSSQISDVWIDFGGVLVGFLFVILFSLIRQHKRST